MAVLTRKQRFYDSIELKNDDGSLYKVLTIELDLDKVMSDYNKARNNVFRAQQKLKENPNDPTVLEEYGQSIVSVISLLFGEENTKCLLEFYENRYTEMLEMTLPYIKNELEPKMQELVKQKVEQMRAQFTRAQRRKFFK